MNTQNTGAQTRRALSLHLGGRRHTKALDQKRTHSSIPNHELRRLVAAMID